VTLLWQGVGLGDPQRSLPTPNILWFCEGGTPGSAGDVKLQSTHLKFTPRWQKPQLGPRPGDRLLAAEGNRAHPNGQGGLSRGAGVLPRQGVSRPLPHRRSLVWVGWDPRSEPPGHPLSHPLGRARKAVDHTARFQRMWQRPGSKPSSINGSQSY